MRGGEGSRTCQGSQSKGCWGNCYVHFDCRNIGDIGGTRRCRWDDKGRLSVSSTWGGSTRGARGCKLRHRVCCRGEHCEEKAQLQSEDSWEQDRSIELLLRPRRNNVLPAACTIAIFLRVWAAQGPTGVIFLIGLLDGSTVVRYSYCDTESRPPHGEGVHAISGCSTATSC
jgi:hypothetical protein